MKWIILALLPLSLFAQDAALLYERQMADLDASYKGAAAKCAALNLHADLVPICVSATQESIRGEVRMQAWSQASFLKNKNAEEACVTAVQAKIDAANLKVPGSVVTKEGMNCEQLKEALNPPKTIP